MECGIFCKNSLFVIDTDCNILRLSCAELNSHSTCRMFPNWQCIYRNEIFFIVLLFFHLDKGRFP